jgi:hypothetical protein
MARPFKTTKGLDMQQLKITRLVALMKRRWVSPIDALNHCGLMSLSQRCGELRRSGVKVVDKWVTRDGSRHKAYRIVVDRPDFRACKSPIE